jgi:hypothetical protein
MAHCGQSIGLLTDHTLHAADNRREGVVQKGKTHDMHRSADAPVRNHFNAKADEGVRASF